MKYEVKCLFSFFVYGVRFAASSRKFHAKTYTMALKNLLMEAGFEEDVIISFEKQRVDLKTFSLLDREALAEIIKPVGDRVRLWRIIQDLQAAEQKSTSSVQGVNESAETIETLRTEAEETDVSRITVTEGPSIVVSEPFSLDNLPIEILSSSQDSVEATSLDNNRFAARALNHQDSVTLYAEKIKNLLQSSLCGLEILHFYEKFNSLSDNLRKKLVEFILAEELKKESKYKIPYSLFQTISEAIVKVFPTEKAGIYYIPYQNFKDGHQNAQGKLVDKYSNKRASLRSIGLLSPVKKKRSQALQEVTDPKINANEDEDVKWLLKNTTEKWNLIKDKWNSTHQLRCKILRELNNSQEYITKFAVLASSGKGHELILEDFKAVYPNFENNLILKWSTVADKIIDFAIIKAAEDVCFKQILKKCGIDLNSTQDEKEKQLVALKVLPCLLPPPSMVNRPGKPKWKPSRANAVTSLVLEVAVGDLENAIQMRKEKFYELGIRSQPITVVAKSNEICKYYVNVDDQKYLFTSPIDAIDCCFKAFFAFNLNFPPESNSTYSFIQKFVYKIRTNLKGRLLTTLQLLADELKIDDLN